MVDRETPDGTYRCVDGTSSPYIVWYGGSPGCHDSDSHYAYDNTEGAKCKESDSSTKPAMCEKCKLFRWQENIICLFLKKLLIRTNYCTKLSLMTKRRAPSVKKVTPLQNLQCPKNASYSGDRQICLF